MLSLICVVTMYFFFFFSFSLFFSLFLSFYFSLFLFFFFLIIFPKVIHGDLKPENILVDNATESIKLIDFGFSHIITPEMGDLVVCFILFYFILFCFVLFCFVLFCFVCFTFVFIFHFVLSLNTLPPPPKKKPQQPVGGTLLYAPPSDRYITYAWDDWSCGVILYAMTTYSLPFKRDELVSNDDLELNIPSFISDGFLSFPFLPHFYYPSLFLSLFLITSKKIELVDVLVGLLTINRLRRKSVAQVRGEEKGVLEREGGHFIHSFYIHMIISYLSIYR